MDYIQSIIVGFVQGITEFLPVSSSAHIVITNFLYKLITGIPIVEVADEEIFFDIVVHIGTLCAISVYFWKDIKTLFKAFIDAIIKRDFSSDEAKMCLYILVGTIATGFIALPLKEHTEKLLITPYIVGILLIITGFFLYFAEPISKKCSKEFAQMNFKKAIFIGIAQGLAIFPGLSRSGLTIATGMATGLTRVKAARYSFLLSIPIILGSSLVFPIMELDYNEVMNCNWGAILCGFLVAGIVGYFCIKYFIIFLAKYSMNCFAYYCWVAGVLLFLAFNPWIRLFS